MPVQINEVIVRAIVNPSPGSTGTASQADCPPPGNSGSDAEMTEKILEIIKEKQER